MDVNKFLEDMKDKVLTMWEHRKIYTPYEQQKAFSDESQFISSTGIDVVIENAYPLGNGDLLLILADAEERKFKYYRRLSDIQLNEYPTPEEMLEVI